MNKGNEFKKKNFSKKKWGVGDCFTETYSVPLAKLILKIRGLLVFYCSRKGQHEKLGENEFDYPL